MSCLYPNLWVPNLLHGVLEYYDFTLVLDFFIFLEIPTQPNASPSVLVTIDHIRPSPHWIYHCNYSEFNLPWSWPTEHSVLMMMMTICLKLKQRTQDLVQISMVTVITDHSGTMIALGVNGIQLKIQWRVRCPNVFLFHYLSITLAVFWLFYLALSERITQKFPAQAQRCSKIIEYWNGACSGWLLNFLNDLFLTHTPKKQKQKKNPGDVCLAFSSLAWLTSLRCEGSWNASIYTDCCNGNPSIDDSMLFLWNLSE